MRIRKTRDDLPVGNTPKRKTETPQRSSGTTSGPPDRSGLLRRLGIVVAVAGALALAIFIGLSSGPGPDGVPEGTEVVAVDEATHVEGEVPHDPDVVPAGGAHNSVWANCGVYDSPVPSENAVHSLEHGAVWITYSPDLSADDVDRVESLGRQRDKLLVSPEPDQGVALRLTAWGFRLDLPTADDSRVEQFVNEFAGSAGAPEPGGLCSGGVGAPTN
jgi:hypothetical protein